MAKSDDSKPIPCSDDDRVGSEPDPRLLELVTLLAQSSARRYYTEKLRDHVEPRL
jgi:hypothetical protein